VEHELFLRTVYVKCLQLLYSFIKCYAILMLSISKVAFLKLAG